MLPRTPRHLVILVVAVLLVVLVASIAPPEWYSPLRNFLQQLARFLT